MSTTNIKKKLLRLMRQRDKTLQELLQVAPVLRGSVSRIETRCGKSNCWCAESSEGHVHTRMTWSQDGTLITRKIPPNQISLIAQLADNYRNFRSLRRTLLSLDGEIRDLLRIYQTALTERARKPFHFLASASKNAARVRKSRHKTSKPRKNIS